MSPEVLRMVPPESCVSTAAISWLRASSPSAIWFSIFFRSRCHASRLPRGGRAERDASRAGGGAEQQGERERLERRGIAAGDIEDPARDDGARRPAQDVEQPEQAGERAEASEPERIGHH